MSWLAEIPYWPHIDPEIVNIGPLTIRWYGVTYIIGFFLAYLVLRDLAKRKRWPVEPSKVGDVLFWGILGLFVGARLGWVLFYGIHAEDWSWTRIYKVYEGGMSFHGGLLGILIAYLIFCRVTKIRFGEIFDGITLSAPLGIFAVRMGNYINAELWGRKWDGAWSMRFPAYEQFPFKGKPSVWYEAAAANPEDPRLWGPLRHPSQLYEGLFEGLLMFLLLRFLMLRLGWGGGRITAAFLVAYGAARFVIEYFREPDPGMENVFLGLFTRGQQLCLGMIVGGLIALAALAWRDRRRGEAKT